LKQLQREFKFLSKPKKQKFEFIISSLHHIQADQAWKTWKWRRNGPSEIVFTQSPARIIKQITLLRREYQRCIHSLISWKVKTEESAEGITYKNWSFLSIPREDGISPVKLLFDKSNLVKLIRFPNSSGISPVMPFPGNVLHDKWNRYTLELH
jgi:hypothetical protein